jgi:hypothetical protein
MANTDFTEGRCQEIGHNSFNFAATLMVAVFIGIGIFPPNRKKRATGNGRARAEARVRMGGWSGDAQIGGWKGDAQMGGWSGDGWGNSHST